ncbi:MAG: EF-hand domain-containing protein [Pseudomonadota bacterium]
MIKHLLLLCAALAAPLAGAEPPAAPAHPDPYVPPAQRPSATTPAPAGSALREQALQKLKRRFEQADLDASGSLTRAEAEKAGLGFVARHFDEIDSAQRGKVSFDDLRRYLLARRATH